MRYWFYYSIWLVVPQLYQFRRGMSGGPAPKYFYMIHRGGRKGTSIIDWVGGFTTGLDVTIKPQNMQKGKQGSSDTNRFVDRCL